KLARAAPSHVAGGIQSSGKGDRTFSTEAPFDGRLRPFVGGLATPVRSGLAGVAGRGASVGYTDLQRQVGARETESGIPTLVDKHIPARRHVGLHALAARRAWLVKVVSRRVVNRTAVAPIAQRVARGAEGAGMRFVAVATDDARCVHFALEKGAVLEHFVANLPVREVHGVFEQL